MSACRLSPPSQWSNQHQSTSPWPTKSRPSTSSPSSPTSSKPTRLVPLTAGLLKQATVHVPPHTSSISSTPSQPRTTNSPNTIIPQQPRGLYSPPQNPCLQFPVGGRNDSVETHPRWPRINASSLRVSGYLPIPRTRSQAADPTQESQVTDPNPAPEVLALYPPWNIAWAVSRQSESSQAHNSWEMNTLISHSTFCSDFETLSSEENNSACDSDFEVASVIPGGNVYIKFNSTEHSDSILSFNCPETLTVSDYFQEVGVQETKEYVSRCVAKMEFFKHLLPPGS
ncbi:mucin-5AC-like [Homarus americanus]|uniref:mucin-5AC-like n=1 Tax=Homarus americanus TaxID=6706 RepID=UPI001C45A277|nr:mucin-5AC-like [Homarus americanus]